MINWRPRPYATGPRQPDHEVRAGVLDQALNWLAGGVDGPAHLLELLAPTLKAVHDGALERSGPLPAGEPGAVTDSVLAVGEILPEHGIGAERALVDLASVFAAGAADPACVAYLQAPPLAVAVVADLVASMFNSSLDSWDQASSATAVESEVVRALADLVPSATTPPACSPPVERSRT